MSLILGQPRWVQELLTNMAKELWPGQSPLGKRLHNGGITDKDPWITVVGVVGRIKQYTLDSDSRIAIYYPQTQFVAKEMNVVVRSSGDPAALYSGARQEIQSVDRDLPIFHAVTLMVGKVQGVSPLTAAICNAVCSDQPPGLAAQRWR